MNRLDLVFDEGQTAQLLDYKSLVAALRVACLDYEDGRIQSPARLIMPFGTKATMLSMPASAPDIAVHKLVNVSPDNGARGLPTIHASVTAYSVDTGIPLFSLDGATVTARRTAAISALAIGTLRPNPPKSVLLFGTGKQAIQHVQVLTALYPDLTIFVSGRTAQASSGFCDEWRAMNRNLSPLPDGGALPKVDVVITATTSRTPVYEAGATAETLIVGVGSFKPDLAEIGASTVLNSTIFVDDLVGAHHEAGDLIQASIDWKDVRSLASATGGSVDFDRPTFFKSVGCAAWDLAACRLARQTLESDGRLKKA